MEFKKGDKVIRIKGQDHPEHGVYLRNIYTVDRCTECDLWLQEVGNIASFAPMYFDNAKEYKVQQLLNKIDSCD